jgi:hypothetical protein
MTNTMRIRLAALAVAIFIGALSVAGLAIRDHSQVAATPAEAEAQAQAQPRTTHQTSTFGDEEVELDED